MSLLDKWNKKKFSVYDSEEKSTLELMEKLSSFIKEEVVKEVDNKVSQGSNFTGSWQGVAYPTLSEEGLRGTVENHTSDINTLKTLEGQRPIIIDSEKFGFKGDGTTDNLAAFNSFKNTYGLNAILKFKKDGVYYFSGTRPDLSGVYIDGDNITIKGDLSPRLSNMSLLTNVKFINTNNSTYNKSRNNNLITPLFNISNPFKKLGEKEICKNSDFSNWVNNIFNTTTGETTLEGTCNKTSKKISWTTSFTNNPQTLKPSTFMNGTCYDLNVISNSPSNQYGFLLKTATHIIVIKNAVNSGNWTITTFSSNLTEISRVIKTFNNGGAYGLAESALQNIGIYYKNDKSVSFLVADNPLYNYNGDYGDITYCSFLLDKGTSTNTFYFGSPIEIENYNLNVHKDLSILITGDSIFNGAWNTIKSEDIIKEMLINSPGVGIVNVDNKSTDGANSTFLKSNINDYNLTKYNFVVVMIGTNDIQGNIPITTYSNNIIDIGNSIKQGGGTPIFVIPPIFTTSTVTNGGVTTSNYNLHAGYSQALKTTCIENGFLIANGRRRIQDCLSFYNDNIHLSEYGLIGLFSEVVKIIGENI